MYLVDTNIVSEARRSRREAVDWLRSVNPETIHLSVITIGEIVRGAELKRRSDPAAAEHLLGWLKVLRADYGGRLLPISDAIAAEWGRLAAVRPRGDADGLIGATAIVHGLAIVTRNIRDFEDVGVKVINPFG
jgi:toxin FitB